MYMRTTLAGIAACGCLWLSFGVAAAADRPSSVLDTDWKAQLQSQDEAVRIQTIEELGAVGSKAVAAVEPLTALLGDASATVRAHAAHALGEIGEPAQSALPELAKLTKDSDATARRQAVRAFVRISPSRLAVVRLAARLLEDADPGVRLAILQAIAEAGPQAVPMLIAALKDERTADDYWALLALREIGPAAKEAVPALVEKLKGDQRPEVRREVLLTLAAVGDAAAPGPDAFVAALKDEATAAAATYALGRLGRLTPDAEALVRANVKSNDKFLSDVSLWALARVHADDKELRRAAAEQLIGRLKDGDPLVRVGAARALASLPPAPDITLPIWEKAMAGADEATIRHALDALASLGAPAVPQLAAVLKQGKARAEVAYILGRIGPDAAPATEALAELLADKDEKTVHEAALALANIGPKAKAAVPALVKAIESGVCPNTPALAYALGRIGPDAVAAVPALEKLLASSEDNVALAGAWALVQIQPSLPELAAKTVPALTAGLSHGLPLVRRGAAEALGRLGPAAKDAAPALKKIVGDEDEEPSVREAAATALHSIEGGEAPRVRRVGPLRRRT